MDSTELVKQLAQQTRYTIIDSLPIIQPVRNQRARVFKSLANVGYNATKYLLYYGFKDSFEVTNQGLVVAYTLTPVATHNIKLVKTLLQQSSCAHVLADKDYLSTPLQQELAQKGIDFWTPKRKNIRQESAINECFLKRQRRYIETVFACWQQLFDFEHNRARCLAGLQTHIEQCLLVYTIQRIN